MIKIYKFDSEMWIMIEQCAQEDLAARLSALRDDGNTYRAEIETISGSEILGE